MTRERPSSDRTIERLRQLQARLDALVHESQQLRHVDTEDLTTWPTVTDNDNSPNTPRPSRK